VALAIGAVMPGRAICQASATWAGVAFLGLAAASWVRQPRFEQRERGRRVRRPAEHVAAEGQRSDLQAAAAEWAKLHASSWRGTIGRARAC